MQKRKIPTKRMSQAFIRGSASCFALVFEFDKKYIFYVCFIKCIQGLVPAISIIIVQNTINMIQDKMHTLQEILIYIVLYGTLNIVKAILEAVNGYYNAQFSLRFCKYVDLKILRKATKLKLKDYEDSETYNMINRAQNQNGTSIMSYIEGILGVLREGIAIISTACILLRFRWWIIILVIIIPVIRCILTAVLDKEWYQMRFQRTKDERKSWYINFLLMTGNAFKEIKITGIAKYLLEKYEKIRDNIIKEDIKMQKKNLRLAFVLDSLDGLINSLIFGYTVSLGIRRKILIGDVTAYINCVGSIQNSVQNIFMGIEGMAEQALYINLLFEYLDLQTEQGCGNHIISTINKIEFRNVFFRYKDTYVLKNINFIIDKNSKIAFVGENGSGKTTIVKLILGLYRDYEGEILINDLNLKDIDITKYQKKIGCVFQDFLKYEMSIKENICLGDIDRKIDDYQIWEVLDKVQLASKVRQLDGVETIVGNWFGEQQLSIGEWQRIAIARALVKDAKLYILDEPDASLDIVGQKKMLSLYKKILQNNMGIYISHKVNFVHLLVEKIYVLEEGSIVEEGGHEELINKKGYYFKLYSQCQI